MDIKKTKLTLSGIAKKSIKNIELAKTQSKNSVVIEKKPNKYAPRSNFGKSIGVKSKPSVNLTSSFNPRTNSAPKTSSSITNDNEKRKLAEQRATKRLKGDSGDKRKSGIKKKRIKVNCFKSFK